MPGVVEANQNRLCSFPNPSGLDDGGGPIMPAHEEEPRPGQIRAQCPPLEVEERPVPDGPRQAGGPLAELYWNLGAGRSKPQPQDLGETGQRPWMLDVGNLSGDQVVLN